MRRLEDRTGARALGVALAYALLVSTAFAQGKRGGDDQPQRGGQAGGQAPATAAPAPGPRPSANLEPPPVDTSPLGRYVPGGEVDVYFEFPGINAFADTWSQTAARSMLNETTLGDLLRDLVTQLVDRNRAGANAKLHGADLVEVLDHALQHGILVAALEPTGAARSAVIVFRNGGHKSARGPFAKLIGQMTPADAKPKVTSRAGGRQVVVVDRMPGAPPLPAADPAVPGAAPPPAEPTGASWAWWLEKNDLVMVLGDANAADAVITALMPFESPDSAFTDPPQVAELKQPEGGFTPAAVGFLRLGGPGASPEETRLVAEQGLQGVDLRWGFEGEALMTVARVLAPSPRKGMLSLIDQPTFSASDLPPIPDNTQSFTVLSMDPAKVLDELGPLLDQVQPGLGTRTLASLDKALKGSKNPLDLREDVLAHLGPRMVLYRTGSTAVPAPADTGAAASPLGGLFAALGGAKVPEFTIMIELKDRKAFELALDAMMITANDELKEMLPAPPPASRAGGGNRPGAGGRGGAPSGPGGPGGGGGFSQEGGPAGGGAGGRAAPTEAIKFQLTTISPKTYTLQLPAGMAALTGLMPTITMGQSHVIISTAPPAARMARQAETATSDERWSPASETAAAFGRLPANLLMLSYSDITDTMPEALAALPTALDAALAGNGAAGLDALREVAGGDFSGLASAAGAPGAAPAGGSVGARGGFDGASGPRGGSGGGGSRPSFTVASGPAGADGSGGAPPGGSGSGGPQGGAGAAATAGPLQIDPARIPTPDALRRYLFPSTYAISISDQGLRYEAREAFPNPSNTGIAAALILPAIQSARGGASNAAGTNAAAAGAPAAATPPAPAGPGGGRRGFD